MISKNILKWTYSENKTVVGSSLLGEHRGEVFAVVMSWCIFVLDRHAKLWVSREREQHLTTPREPHQTSATCWLQLKVCRRFFLRLEHFLKLVQLERPLKPFSLLLHNCNLNSRPPRCHSHSLSYQVFALPRRGEKWSELTAGRT